MKTVQTIVAFLCVVSLIVSCKKDVPKNQIPVVNAGRDTLIQLSSLSDSIRLNGSATDADGSVVGYLWSEISGPNTVVISKPASQSTYVKEVTAGIYRFQLMAIDNEGATGIKTISVTVVEPKIYTSTLQPHQNGTELLLRTNIFNPSQSDPTAPELSATAWTNSGSPAYTRGLVKFDMSSISTDAKILSAKLTLYSNPTPLNGNLLDANFGSNNALVIQRVISSWNNNVTWQNQPSGDAATQIAIPHTNASRLDLIDIDVTNLVKGMMQSGNHGFLLKLANEVAFTSRIFCSSKYNDASKHPKLVIEYTK
ncbi:MAG TPA: DNRLRE domain-containing protein [Chitinophagaceae bacterium]|jgi:hypothetical protein|nr:DNRLRE domain-containing protein [Chitinophagaceae bacterium]